MLRKIVCTSLWMLATGVTGAIVYLGMGTNSLVVTALGAIGILAATTGIYLALDAKRDGVHMAMIGGIALWILGEAFVIPSEINYWSATVTARAEREMDYQRQAQGRRLILDDTASRLAKEKPARSSKKVQAAIDAELARVIGSGRKAQTLSALTKDCRDLTSPAIKLCGPVMSLREELATAQDYEKDSAIVWAANSQLSVNTEEAHGAHDGPDRLAEIFGRTPVFWSNVILGITILLLWFTRGFSLAMGWRDAKVSPKSESVTRTACVTEAPFQEEEIKVGSVPQVTAAEPMPDLTNVTNLEAYRNAPQTLNPKPKRIDPAQAEIDAMVEEIRSGHAISPAEARKRVNRALAANGRNALAQRAVGKRLREAANKAGFRIEANNGRRYGVAGGRAKEAARLGAGVSLAG